MHLPKITKIVHKGRSGGAVRAGIGSIGICISLLVLVYLLVFVYLLVSVVSLFICLFV